jgi:hypothetical protein
MQTGKTKVKHLDEKPVPMPHFLLHILFGELSDCGLIPSRGNEGVSLFTTMSKWAVETIQPPMQWVVGENQQIHDADN